MEYEILSYASQGLFWIIELAILIACIILVVKNKSTPFIMMLIGTMLSMFFATARTILFALPISDLDMDQTLIISSVVSTIQALGYSLFGIGLLIFAYNYKKQIG